MNNPRRSVIIPAEILNREFDAKLLLAAIAAERGFKVIVGCRSKINNWMSFMPRSIYLAKGMTARTLRMFKIMKDLGHAMVSCDEEALVYFSPEIYYKRRLSPPVLSHTSALFAWGQNNYDLWRSAKDYHGVPIYITGHPRADLMRPELKNFYSKDIKKLHDQYGQYILVNSNFSLVNKIFSNLTPLPDPDASGKEAQGKLGMGYTVELARHKNILFKEFLNLIPTLAQKFPNYSIVVRPHPAENHQAWQNAAHGLSNVHVIHQGNIIPWILASKIVIHNGCTTAIEAALLNHPVVAYQPVIDQDYDDVLPNRVSYSATNPDSLIAMIKDLDDQKSNLYLNKDNHKLKQEEELKNYINGLKGPFASERIVDALEELDDNGVIPAQKPSLNTRFDAHKRIWQRRWKKYKRSKRPGHRNNALIIESVFPTLPLSEVKDKLERLKTNLNRFDNIKVTQFARNVFKLTKIKS
ncbi:MAG: hypothetical protein K1X44_01595 [Alphaproteobacteria bacterium]|nr:hypothetical protein [Alphaproteobacteria bacterium]